MSTATTSTRLYKLGPTDQIPLGEGRAFAIADQQVAVFRLRDGQIRALSAVCPHRGGPLADGLTDNQQVICPLHNHAFRLIDGHCTTGAPPVRTYQARVENGEIVLQLHERLDS
jgi:nitrite reductase [NAD(P)H] small subunit